MRALAFDGQRAVLVERPEPKPSPDEALVRVSLAGVCRTDLELVRGYMSFRGVLGHEFVGRVLEGPSEWRGQRVVGEINFACGRCALCARGLRRHCPERRVMGIHEADGAFAEAVLVPVENLHRVPDGVPDHQAVFVEPLAAAFEVLAQVDVPKGIRALVLGDGKLGQLVAQVLDDAGARVTAIGRHREKLALLARRGIEAVPCAEFRGERAPLVVEATGTLSGFRRAVELTEPRGTLVLKSTVAAREALDLAPLVIHEITVVGSRCGPFAPALRLLAAGLVDVTPLVGARYPLREALAAFAHAQQPGAGKVLVEP